MPPKRTFDVNPFFVYITGFLISISIYQLDWSALYPPLSIYLLTFLGVSFVISFLFGLYINQKGILRYKIIKNKINVKSTLIFVTIGYLAEFIYGRQIPLLSIMSLAGNDYMDFGIPTFHVILISFSSFLTIHLFNSYRSEKNKTYLYSSLYLMIFPILIFNRGMFLLNASSLTFVYLFSTNTSKIKIYSYLTGVVFIILIGFGLLGNLRISNQNIQNGEVDANEILMTIGDAKPSFVESAVPKEYFWAYLYISSPLANLQFNINKNNGYSYDVGQFFEYVNGELNFDFISKRIFSMFNTERIWYKQITSFLTVSTVYSRSYSYLGWLGIFLTFSMMMIYTLSYFIILKPSSDYFVTGIAILNTIMLFCIFDNMFSFTGLSFQLIYPILFSIKLKKNVTS